MCGCTHLKCCTSEVWKHADVCWRMLTSADVCWLKYVWVHTFQVLYISSVETCWHMLTYADVCWRLLTYACTYLIYIFVLNMYSSSHKSVQEQAVGGTPALTKKKRQKEKHRHKHKPRSPSILALPAYSLNFEPPVSPPPFLIFFQFFF
jgi:hypothetical protein